MRGPARRRRLEIQGSLRTRLHRVGQHFTGLGRQSGCKIPDSRTRDHPVSWNPESKSLFAGGRAAAGDQSWKLNTLFHHRKSHQARV